MKKFDWNKITEGKGDEGYSDLLFGERSHKSDFRFLVLADAESAHVSLARIGIHLGDEKIRERLFLEKLNEYFVGLMGKIATPPDKCDRYAESKMYRDILMRDGAALSYLDEKTAEMADRMNRRNITPGWTDYSRIKDGAAAEIFEFGIRIRRLELSVMDVAKLVPSESEYFFKTDMKVLNRMSKVAHMWANLREHGKKSVFDARETADDATDR